MGGEKTELPKVELDLTYQSLYGQGNNQMNVYQLKNFGKYPVYIQMLQSDGPFDVDKVKINGKEIVEIKKTNVSMVTVYYDQTNNVVMFETYYKDEKVKNGNGGALIHRYHARENNGTGRWLEYMYGNNDSLNSSNVDDVLNILKGHDVPLDRIQASGKYFQVVRVHAPKTAYPKPDSISDVGTGSEVSIIQGDLEAQTENRQEEKHYISNRGMTAAIATGSVGGAAIGGTLIYMVSNLT